MLDALGSPQSVLVLGATSDIGAATVARLAGRGRLRRVVLAGRPGPSRDASVTATEVLLGSGATVEAVDFDAADVASHRDRNGHTRAHDKPHPHADTDGDRNPDVHLHRDRRGSGPERARLASASRTSSH